jgi:hypothetical protein
LYALLSLSLSLPQIPSIVTFTLFKDIVSTTEVILHRFILKLFNGTFSTTKVIEISLNFRLITTPFQLLRLQEVAVDWFLRYITMPFQLKRLYTAKRMLSYLTTMF